jgi:hypothetical protein
MPDAIVQVFDPPMCCSSGLCGPEADPELVRFAADLKWLSDQGVTVERFDPARQPDAFVGTPAVLEAVARRPNGPLPVILVNGRFAHQGSYPSRRELAAWAGVTDGPPPPAELEKDGAWRRCRSALDRGRLVVLRVRPAASALESAPLPWLRQPAYAETVEEVLLDSGDPAEGVLLSALGLEEPVSAPVTALLAPPASLLGTIAGEIDEAVVAQVLLWRSAGCAPGSGCCG